jgi:hypothetical protein
MPVQVTHILIHAFNGMPVQISYRNEYVFQTLLRFGATQGGEEVGGVPAQIPYTNKYGEN